MILAGCVGKACRRCGAPFAPKRQTQRFCSTKCRYRFNYQRVYYPRHVKSKRPRWIVRYCKNPKCAVRFSISGHGRGFQHRLYCSNPCARAAQKRRERARLAAKTSGG